MAARAVAQKLSLSVGRDDGGLRQGVLLQLAQRVLAKRLKLVEVDALTIGVGDHDILTVSVYVCGRHPAFTVGFANERTRI